VWSVGAASDEGIRRCFGHGVGSSASESYDLDAILECVSTMELDERTYNERVGGPGERNVEESTLLFQLEVLHCLGFAFIDSRECTGNASRHNDKVCR
jgi:hypothetical protein